MLITLLLCTIVLRPLLLFSPLLFALLAVMWASIIVLLLVLVLENSVPTLHYDASFVRDGLQVLVLLGREILTPALPLWCLLQVLTWLGLAGW